MPSVSARYDPLAHQPAAKSHPKPPELVLAEKEAQWLFTDEELARSPSLEDGMTVEQERTLCRNGLGFIMQVAIMLKLPQITLSIAGIFFNRFLMRYSMVHKPPQAKPLHYMQIAATCLFLATKTTETPRKLKELITAICRVAQKNHSLIVPDDSKDFWRWRDTLLFNEDVLLETLCFDVSPTPPHRPLFDLLAMLYRAYETYAQASVKADVDGEAKHEILDASRHRRLRNAAWAFINDTGMTHLSLRYSARTLAAAAVYAASKFIGPDVAFPDDDRGRPWWTQWGVNLRDIREACNVMVELYEADPEKLASEEGGIYTRLQTPLDGDEASAKTRVKMQAFGEDRGGSEEGFDRPALMGTEVEELEKREQDAKVERERQEQEEAELEKRQQEEKEERERRQAEEKAERGKQQELEKAEREKQDQRKRAEREQAMKRKRNSQPPPAKRSPPTKRSRTETNGIKPVDDAADEAGSEEGEVEE